MSISLEKAINTCKVSTGWSNRIQSDRFLNPSQMVCVTWGGYDLTGRQVSPDSFYTKTAGCNSAQDRVVVENMLRPQYSDYITLNMGAGLAGDIYSNVDAQMGVRSSQANMRENNDRTGNYGLQFSASTKDNSCSVNAYDRNMAQENTYNRQAETFQNYERANSNARCSGSY